MRRVMYRWLLLAHPAAFRNRFGTEMLEVFENEREPLRLILDVLISLLRQRILRPDFRRERPLEAVPYMGFALERHLAGRRRGVLVVGTAEGQRF
jgi:hypothetical protein